MLAAYIARLGQVPEASAWHAFVQCPAHVPKCCSATQSRHVEVAQQHPEYLSFIGGKGPGIQLDRLVGIPELHKVIDGILACLWPHTKGVKDRLEDFHARGLVGVQAILRGRKLVLLCC